MDVKFITFFIKKYQKFIQIGSSIEYGKLITPERDKKKFTKNLLCLWKAKLLSTKFCYPL